MTNQNNGLIYKTQDYKESSRLLFIYTKQGKKTLVAKGVKGIKHPNRILSQVLTLIEFQDSDKSIFSLSKAQIINDFYAIKTNYETMKQVSIVLELIDHLITEDANHAIIYALIVELLEKDVKLASLVIPLKMVYILGYGLDFVGDNPTGFSIKEASVTTLKNNLYSDIDLETTVLLSKLYFYKVDQTIHLEDYMVKKIQSFIKAFYQYHLDYDFKSLRE